MITLQANDEMVSFDPDNTGSTPLFGFKHSMMAKTGKYYALITEHSPVTPFTVRIAEGVDQNANMLNFGVFNYRDEDGKHSKLVISGNTTMLLDLSADGEPEIIDKTVYTHDDSKEIQKYIYDTYGVAISLYTVRLREGLIAINIGNAIWPGQTIDSKVDYAASFEIERQNDGTYQIAYAISTHSASPSIIDTANGDATSIQLGNYDESTVKGRLDLIDGNINDIEEDIDDIEDDISDIKDDLDNFMGIARNKYVSR